MITLPAKQLTDVGCLRSLDLVRALELPSCGFKRLSRYPRSIAPGRSAWREVTCWSHKSRARMVRNLCELDYTLPPRAANTGYRA